MEGGGRGWEEEVRIKVMRTRVYPKVATENKCLIGMNVHIIGIYAYMGVFMPLKA